MALIDVKNLSKIYGEKTFVVKALDDVSFSIEQGELVVILGASGAGKSTLLNILGGMDSPTSGSYIVSDVDVAKKSPKELGLFRRFDVGFVFQFYNLIPSLTALENVDIAASLTTNPFNSYETLEQVDLGARANNFPAQLSGGEQQRVAIARAVVKKPKLLLCDEPTGALDSKTGVQIIKLLTKLAKDLKMTVIIVTHNAALREMADHLIRIHDGKITEDIINKNPSKVEDIVW